MILRLSGPRIHRKVVRSFLQGLEGGLRAGTW